MVRSRTPIHYGWVIVAVGFLVIFACIGLGRYVYLLVADITASAMIFALFLPTPSPS